LLTSTWVLFIFYEGGIHGNGLLREPESEEAAVAFMHILLGCLVGTSCFLFSTFLFLFLSQQDRFLTLVLKFAETASFHGGITLASIFVLESLDRIARWRKSANLPSSIRQQFRYA
jgi:hypothetical protein